MIIYCDKNAHTHMCTQQVIEDEELNTHIRKKYKNIRTFFADQHPLKLNYVASLQLERQARLFITVSTRSTEHQ